MVVTAGANNFRDPYEVNQRQVRRVVKAVPHPMHLRAGAYNHDLALLKLDRPLDLTKHNIGRVCLPLESHLIKGGETLYATGTF